MELRHLRYFLMVAEELNFTRAAERLHISQPPLSRQIKELEEELQARLLERNNKRVELTEAGIYFQHEAKKVLKHLDKAALHTRKIATHISGEFRIGYISSTFSGTISQLLQTLSQDFPFVNFKLFEVPTVQQIAALEQGKLDLGILRAPVVSPEIATTTWFNDGFSLVYNKTQQRIDQESDVQGLRDATFVFFNKTYAPHYYRSLLEICATYGFTPNVVHESNNVHSILQLVKNGMGVSILPSSISQNYAYSELGFWEFPGLELSTQVVIAQPRDKASVISRRALSFLLENPS